MKVNYRRFKTFGPFVFVVVLTLSSAITSSAQNGKPSQPVAKVHAKGLILAYEELSPVFRLAHSGNTHALLVKLITKNADEIGQFVIVRTNYQGKSFSAKRPVVFELQRQSTCDDSLESLEALTVNETDGTKTLIQRLKISKGGSLDDVPRKSLLPCFLQSGVLRL